VRVYADDPNLQGQAFQRELQAVAACHAGSVDLRVRLEGPNLLRPNQDVVARSLNGLQAASPIPLLVGADIERGVIARVADAPGMPNLMAYGAAGDLAQARRLGEITAHEARAVGIQWAFAPVADVNDDPDNPIVGDRSFGEDPEMVSRMVAAYIEGAHAGGMLVTAKHFPGHGDTGTDSHVSIVTLNQSLDHLRRVEFAPFRAAIGAGVDAIMLAHERMPALDPDPDKVATTSARVIQKYLRGELGFKGVVITDAMEMKGLTDLYKNDPHPEARAAVDAIKAGADIIMLPDHVDEAYQAILAAVKSGEIPESRIDESVARILAMKEKAGLFKNRMVDESKVSEVFSSKEDFDFAQQVADSAVTLVRNMSFALPMEAARIKEEPAKSEKIVLVLFTDSMRSPLGKAFEEQFKVYQPNAQIRHVYYDNRATWEANDVTSVVQAADKVVVATFMTNIPGKKSVAGGKIVNVFGLNGTTAQLFSQILGIGGNKVMVVSLGSPYLILHYPIIQNYVCTFSVSSTSEQAAVKALFGEIRNHARLPVTLPGIAERGFAIEWPQRAMKVN
jgi:beta-N-acetylhexosaminidase